MNVTGWMLQLLGEMTICPWICNVKEENTDQERIYQEVLRRGLVRSSDLSGPSDRMHLKRLCEQGKIQRLARGVYAPASSTPTSSSVMAVIGLKIPKGVICLISALNFYDITTQVPWEVWIAIPHNSVTPKISEYQVRYVWYSEEMLSEGVDIATVNGAEFRIFNPAKTIADCFKYRNKIGMDVCIHALREGWKRRLFTMDDLWRFSKVCRVATVIRPYLEALP